MLKTLYAIICVALVLSLSSCQTKRQPLASDAPKETSSQSQSQASVPDDDDGAKIIMATQEYEGDNIVEVPYFANDGRPNAILEAIDQGYNLGLLESYLNYTESESEHEGGWIEIRSYPFSSENYLQAVSTLCTFPTYGTDGDLQSVNYDIKNKVWLGIDDAMAREATSQEQLASDVERLFEPEFEGHKVESVIPAGFLIRANGDGEFIEFLLEVTTVNADGDPWKSFYSYTPAFDEFFKMNAVCLFDPSEPDQMDPPLSYQKGAENP